ncbi:related to Actin-interacting protein 1 [Saccharomycodes ludwigii]|uniref:Related to Actin-interacting protein 1 n=1 Tax=Saccharomycodes ludwigii TaxID=36035 RepID=A0A376B9Z6_9ASCO|nr:hypothetical protein SCDLUD_004084 [Saccharomycodes ludwigii]KAH3899792.1 hypothetical protein SCDLUD_004084 [Saccharomycodes ludwigii]SSD61477.1 related to Actin-interacting protein 1 [Saccharomycodes ludwigii]
MTNASSTNNLNLKLIKSIPPLPTTERNFSTKLSYHKQTNSLLYTNGKSCFIRPLDDTNDNKVYQFTGHGNVNCTVAKFSPIGQFVASGDENGKVIIWEFLTPSASSTSNVEEDEPIKVKSEFEVLAGRINDISWDVEGRRLCVVGEGRDKFGVFISWDSGNSLGEVSGHSTTINACHIRQGRPMRCFTVDDDGSSVFYEGPPFKFHSSDRVHHDQGKFIRAVEFSPSSGKTSYCVSCGSDRKIVCYDGKTGEFLKYVQDPDEEIKGGFYSLSWVNENSFVTASADCVIRLWDVETGKCLQKWTCGSKLEDQQVGVIAISLEKVVSVSLDGTINILTIGASSNTMELERRIVGHTKGITVLSGNVSGSYDGRVVEWEPEFATANKMFAPHSNMIISLDTTKFPTISSVSWDDTFKSYTDGTICDNANNIKFNSQPRCSSTHDGITGVVTFDNELIIIDDYESKILYTYKISSLSPSVVAITLNKEYVVLGYEQTNEIKALRISELESMGDSSTILTFPALRSTPSCISISPSNNYVAVGDILGKIVLYDFETKQVKTSRWAFHTGKITSIAWKKCSGGDENEEDLVATGSLDTHIIIYSVKRPMKVIKMMNAHKDGISVVQWNDSINNKENIIVSAGADACIKLWELI